MKQGRPRYLSPSARARARELRKSATKSERLLWQHLRRKQLGGHRFRRQQPIGPYIVDFYCFEQRLVIEIDGGHHGEQAKSDAERTRWLEANGVRLVRFWNNEVLGELEAVKQVILKALGAPPPQSSPGGGGDLVPPLLGQG